MAKNTEPHGIDGITRGMRPAEAAGLRARDPGAKRYANLFHKVMTLLADVEFLQRCRLIAFVMQFESLEHGRQTAGLKGA